MPPNLLALYTVYIVEISLFYGCSSLLLKVMFSSNSVAKNITLYQVKHALQPKNNLYNFQGYLCVSHIIPPWRASSFVLLTHLSPSLMPCSLALGLVAVMMLSYSSAANRLGTSPELSILLMSSRNSSITIYEVIDKCTSIFITT